MRIIISYAYGEYLTLAHKLADDLGAEGHRVFLDYEGLRESPEWVDRMEDAIDWAVGRTDGEGLSLIGTDDRRRKEGDSPGRLLLLMSEKTIGRSTPTGESLNLLGKILSRKIPVIPAMILWCEPPLTIFRIQWLDLQHLNQPTDSNEKYRQILDRLIDAIESEKPELCGDTVLFKSLDPITFELNIAESIGKFIGREWLVQDIDRWMQDPDGKKIYWIQGGPGIGKTALAIWYSNYRVLSAFYLFKYDDARTLDPRRLVKTLAYQLSTQFPAYRHRLERIDLQTKKDLDGPGLLNELIIEPFHFIGEPDHPVIILLDGLDEIFLYGESRANPDEMVKTIRALYRNTKTKPWFRCIFSSRDNIKIENELQLDDVDRVTVNPSDTRNLDDIRSYLVRELKDITKETVSDDIIDDICEKSQGYFIYVSFFCNAIRNGVFSLNDPKFPSDLSDAYLQFFKRQFPESTYREKVAPVLRVICAAREALPVEILMDITGLDEEEENELEYLTSSLFPVENEEIQPFHTTIVEWISDKKRSGNYFISLKKGHEALAENGFHQVMDGKIPDYYLKNLAYHLLETGDEERLTNLMTNPDFFVQAYDSDEYALKRLWVTIEEKTKLRLEKVYALPKDVEFSYPYLNNTGILLYKTGYLSSASEWFSACEFSARKRDAIDEMQASLGNQANILYTRGDLDGAMALHKEEEQICRELGNVDSLQISLGNQANILYTRGDLDGAMALHKEQEQICREIGNIDSLATSLGNQALILKDRGDLDGAMELLKEQERISREIGNIDSLATSLGNHANILYTRGDLDGAMELYKEQERISREIGNVGGLASSLGNQALILAVRGELDGAMALHKEVERICRELGNVKGLASSLGNQALILAVRGELDGAMAIHKEEERIYRELGDVEGLANSLGNQANILYVRGDLDGAMELLKEQERICRELGNVNSLQISLGNQANILYVRGDLDGAMVLHKEEEQICRELGNVDSLATSLGNQANILYTRGDLDGAMELYKEQERICREIGNVNSLQISLGNQANILYVRGDLEGAMALHKEEEQICRELGNVNSLQISLGNQALILKDRGDLDEAMELLKEQERISRELGNVDSLATSLGFQALILKDCGDLDGAMELLKEQERISREIGNVDSLATSLGNQANILYARGDLDGAMELHKEEERICRELGDIEGLARSLTNQALCLKQKENHIEAEALVEEAYDLATGHGYTALAQGIEELKINKSPSKRVKRGLINLLKKLLVPWRFIQNIRKKEPQTVQQSIITIDDIAYIPEREYFFQIADNGALISIISSKEGLDIKNPYISYDGGEHALVHYNDTTVIIFDYLHPEVRAPLMEFESVIIREVDLDNQELKREYKVPLKHVERLELPPNYKNGPTFSDLSQGNEEKLVFSPEELTEMAKEIKE